MADTSQDNVCNFTTRYTYVPHPSWMGQPTIFVNQEVVYYILSGTPRSTQKYFWSNLRVEFSGENHLLLIWGKMPNQISWITKNLGSRFNSDLFKKKFVQIHPLIAKLWLSKSGFHFQKITRNCYLKQSKHVRFGQIFFLNRSELNLFRSYFQSF